MTITKSILSQYSDLLKEKTELQNRIAKTKKQIERIEEEGTVKDTVSGGSGGTQHFVVEGYPLPEYSRKRTLLIIREKNLGELEIQISEILNEIENFISQIDDSRMRRIISLRFIDNLSWNQVADKIGGGNTEDSVRKAFTRYMEK